MTDPTTQQPAESDDQAAANAILGVKDAFLQRINDFEDPRQEWRRLSSELFGTFFLVLVAAGGVASFRRSGSSNHCSRQASLSVVWRFASPPLGA